MQKLETLKNGLAGELNKKAFRSSGFEIAAGELYNYIHAKEFQRW